MFVCGVVSQGLTSQLVIVLYLLCYMLVAVMADSVVVVVVVVVVVACSFLCLTGSTCLSSVCGLVTAMTS